MLRKCEHCGEEAVDDSESQEVCGACGIVVEGTIWESPNYVPSTNLFFTPYNKFGSKTQQTEKPSFNLKYGLSTLDTLCHIYNLDAKCKSEITDLFKLICSAKRYRHRDDAAISAACCLLVVQRKNKQSIPISSICRELKCTRRKFSYYLKILRSWLHSNEKSYILDENTLPTDDQKTGTADDGINESLSSIIDILCDKAGDEEKNQLIQKTTALVKLVDSCWLLTGRSPRNVVVACCYLCWKSMHPSRRNASFPRFCSVFDIHDSVAKKRIPEMKALLLKLGKKIPSYDSDYVNEKNLLFHLGTILENSETLRNDLFPDAKTKEAVDSTEYSEFRFPARRLYRREPKCPVIYHPDMNASDIEISDSEIESYIVSDTKKKVIKLLCESNTSDTKEKVIKLCESSSSDT